MLLCLSASDFPSQSSNEIEPEVRSSRAAVIAPEPIPEMAEIKRTRVKKTARSVMITAEKEEYPITESLLCYCGKLNLILILLLHP